MGGYICVRYLSFVSYFCDEIPLQKQCREERVQYSSVSGNSPLLQGSQRQELKITGHVASMMKKEKELSKCIPVPCLLSCKLASSA